MSKVANTSDPDDAANEQRANGLTPLPGEPGIPNVAQASAGSVSKKGLLAVALLVFSLVAVSAISIQRFVASGKKSEDIDSKRAVDRPAAASTDPRRLDMSAASASNAASVVGKPTRIPALVPTDDEATEPIGVRRTGQATGAAGGAKSIPPEDAPAVLVSSRPTSTGAVVASPRQRAEQPAIGADSTTTPGPQDSLDDTRRNLEAYQRQLQGLLDKLTKSSAATSGSPSAFPAFGATSVGVPSSSGAVPSQGVPATGGLFGGQLQASATPRVMATTLGYRSLTLPKGTAFTCALKTKVVSAASGFVSCQVQRNVYGDDGRVLLIERGSHMDGEYRIASVKPGTVRIPVLWTRIRTPNGVTVDIDSPGAGQLGESGIDGYVDNRWGERIGAALLLSLIDDSVQLALHHESNTSQTNAVVLPTTTTNSSKLAEKVLDSTINIPPLIYQNQGGTVGIYVARDVDFSSVYELKPVSR